MESRKLQKARFGADSSQVRPLLEMLITPRAGPEKAENDTKKLAVRRMSASPTLLTRNPHYGQKNTLSSSKEKGRGFPDFPKGKIKLLIIVTRKKSRAMSGR